MKLLFKCFLLISLTGCMHSSNPFCHVKTKIEYLTGENLTWKRQRECLTLNKSELTLNEAISYSVANNPHLQAIYENLGIAQAELAQASFLKNPLADWNIRYADAAYMVEGVLIQNLLDLYLMPLRKRKASAELAAVEAEIIKTILDLIAEVKIAYYTLQIQEKLLEHQHLLKEAVEAAALFSAKLHQAGNITALEEKKYALLYENAVLELVEKELAVKQAKEKLHQLLGLSYGIECWTISHEITHEELIIPCCIEYSVICSNFELQALRHRMRALAAEVGIKVKETVWVEAGAGVQTEREPDGEWFTGPALLIGLPIFDWGSAQRAKGKAELWKMVQEYQMKEIELLSATRLVSFRLKKSQEIYSRFSTHLFPLAQEITDGSLLYYSGMQEGLFTLLEAKREEIQVEEKMLSALLELVKSESELDKLLKGGSL